MLSAEIDENTSLCYNGHMAMSTQWSKIKKRLEEFLCDSLKDRVSYFATSYRGAHDGQGRVCICVDKKEILNMPFTAQWSISEETERLRAQENTHDADVQRQAIQNVSQTGTLSPCTFSDAYDAYCTLPVSKCLTSENYLTRAMAFMDKRVGRRTLEKIKDSVAALPEFLQYFYRLRMHADDTHGKTL